MSLEPERCTYAGCKAIGIGKTSPAAKNWLCGEHLERVRSACESFYSEGGEDRCKRMLGEIARARGYGKKTARNHA